MSLSFCLGIRVSLKLTWKMILNSTQKSLPKKVGLGRHCQVFFQLIRLTLKENFKDLVLSQYKKLSKETIFPSELETIFSKICSFYGKIYFFIQIRPENTLKVFDLKNGILLTKKILKKKIIHLEMGIIKNEEVVFTSFKDNSLKIFNVKSKVISKSTNILQMINSVAQSKLKNSHQKENNFTQNCTPSFILIESFSSAKIQVLF